MSSPLRFSTPQSGRRNGCSWITRRLQPCV
ncbi:hypothetical protein CGRA01v4_14710 [Colletotrichum graminicola]|nr:hypothetical protein CGRA01v4_14710 [Colletotrichum graminicola]